MSPRVRVVLPAALSPAIASMLGRRAGPVPSRPGPRPARCIRILLSGTGDLPSALGSTVGFRQETGVPRAGGQTGEGWRRGMAGPCSGPYGVAMAGGPARIALVADHEKEPPGPQ